MGKHGRARVIRAELERRAALLKNGDVRFRFIDSTRQWAVYLPHIGKEMGVFSRFDAAAEYALRHRQPGPADRMAMADGVGKSEVQVASVSRKVKTRSAIASSRPGRG